jgi:hypothetical protein
MASFKKYLPIAFALGFLLFGLDAFFQARPEAKNERVYKMVKQYSPYYLDKRFGGLEILNKEDKEFKEKPTNSTLFKEFEKLEKKWGKKHLKIENNTLIILDNNGSQQATLVFQNKEESDFAHTYYGL